MFTCSSNAFLSTLLDYIAAHGEHISAHDIYLSGATDHSNLANNTVESRSLIQPLLPMTLNIHEAESDVYTDSDSSVKIKSLGLSDEEQALSCGSHSANTLSGLPLATKDDSILSELKTLLCIFASKAISGGRVLISSPSSSDLSSSSSSCHREKKSLISLESVPASIPAPSTCCLDFPPSLTAYQRMALHELCEELGLYHRSINDGELRCLQVSDVPFLLQGEVVEEKLSKDAKSENQRAFPRAIGGENGHPEELAVAASSGKECTTSSSSSKVLKRPTDEGAKISLRQPVGMKKKPIPAKVMESEDDILAAAIAQNQVI